MRWKKYSIKTTQEAEELISAMLMEMGIDGVLIEDKAPVPESANGGLFGDVLPDMPEDDHLAEVSFFIDYDEISDAEEEKLLSDVKAGLEEMRSYANVGEASVTKSVTEDIDWINNWKEHFESFEIDDIKIVPSWLEEEVDEKDYSMVLTIDPGTAFGTGKHETTQLAIKLIRKNLERGDAMLDVGTGSGILGIVSLKDGAGYVYGTDIDEMAFPALADNIEKNDIDKELFDYVMEDVIADDAARKNTLAVLSKKTGKEKYDIVVSNIIAEILSELIPNVPEMLKDGGWFVGSGILREKESLVRNALEGAGFTIEEVMYLGEWCGISARL